ncbi:MAG: hypothetical protein ACPGYT_02130 [Nitrospirales bacterium]
MIARLTSALMIFTVGGALTLIPVSSFAGSAQDAFKKLQGQSRSDTKARSSSSSSQATEKKGAAKKKVKKEMSRLLDKASPKN